MSDAARVAEEATGTTRVSWSPEDALWVLAKLAAAESACRACIEGERLYRLGYTAACAAIEARASDYSAARREAMTIEGKVRAVLAGAGEGKATCE